MKTQNPFIGRAKGSLANVVATTYNGQNVLKSKPLEVRNPQSPKQLNVRGVLAQAAALGKSFSAISGIAKRAARTGRVTQKTARTALLSAILSKKIGVAPDLRLSSVGISLQGLGIAQQEGLIAQLTSATRLLEVGWSSTIPTGGAGDDLVSCVLFDLDTGKVQSFASASIRNNLEFYSESVDPSFIASSNLGVFLMFDSHDGLRYDAVSSINVSVV